MADYPCDLCGGKGYFRRLLIFTTLCPWCDGSGVDPFIGKIPGMKVDYNYTHSPTKRGHRRK